MAYRLTHHTLEMEGLAQALAHAAQPAGKLGTLIAGYLTRAEMEARLLPAPIAATRHKQWLLQILPQLDLKDTDVWDGINVYVSMLLTDTPRTDTPSQYLGAMVDDAITPALQRMGRYFALNTLNIVSTRLTPARLLAETAFKKDMPIEWQSLAIDLCQHPDGGHALLRAIGAAAELYADSPLFKALISRLPRLQHQTGENFLAAAETICSAMPARREQVMFIRGVNARLDPVPVAGLS